MRWAVAGTIVATREALAHGLAINLGGGYHHAKPTSGEGFNVYNDVAVAIAQLRAENALAPDDTVLYVDCDAHQGNGVCHCFLNDRTIKIFDVFNADIYPSSDIAAQNRIDHACPLRWGTGGDEYLLTLERELPAFLDGQRARGQPKLAIYNAGSDVHESDPLGALKLTDSNLLERDVRVVEHLRKRNIPVALVLGGGYTPGGYALVANSVLALLKRM
jgi:histone deacetylase 11